MLYEITDATVSMQGENVLNHVDFGISGSEKIAIVGKNGAGKTTLLRLIIGEIQPDRDDKRKTKAILKSRALTIGMLKQLKDKKDLNMSVQDLLIQACPSGDTYEKERYEYEVEYNKIFTGFGFSKEDKGKKLSCFSGGEQTKIALIRLLLMKPDILLLDEPTNHLDNKTIEWLEMYMRSYKKAVVMVSHDRYFLDRVAEVVYELNKGKLTRYAGNYSFYKQEKIKKLEKQKKAFERQQKEISNQEQLIEKFKHKASKSSFARARKKMLQRIDRIEKPDEITVTSFVNDIIPVKLGSKNVFEAKDLKIGYDKVLYDFSFRLRRGQKIAVIGENGSGKSTLLKTVAGILKPVSGKLNIGNNIDIGYYDQDSASKCPDKSIIQYFMDSFPSLTQKEARGVLGKFLFTGKDVYKKIDSLSGGERSRLYLMQLIYELPNFMILDEPTNHCDIESREVLESAFMAYKGSMIFVSHDRYFIKKVADAILLIKNNEIFYYPFGYDHYIERINNASEGNVTALRLAKEQALISQLNNVPEAEKHRIKELSHDEIYADWRFRPVNSKLETCKGKVELLVEEIKELNEVWMSSKEFWSGIKKEESDIGKKIIELEKQLQEADLIWQEACLEQNDLWNELYI